MKILWVSSIAWKSQTGYPYPVNGAGAVSGSLFQQAMIEGLEKLGHTVDIVSDYPYAAGANLHRQIQWAHNDFASDIAVKTCGMPYFSLFYKAYSCKKAVKQKVKMSEYDLAVAYLVHQPYMNAIAYAKKINRRIKTVLICPDLPDMMDMSLSHKKIKTFLKKLDKKRIDHLYAKMDGFVLFAEPMLEKINIGDSKYTVIEGVASIEDLDASPVDKENFIMYAGTLHKNIGIENIISSLDYMDDAEIKLKIYGTGELEKYIKEKAGENSRIVFGGFVDRKTLFEEEKKALALINARNPSDAYTKYSFPSKTFEYLYSGTPFVTTRLKGVPKEYTKYLFEIEDNVPQFIAFEINKICRMSKEEIIACGCKARRFVVQKKTKEEQAKKLSDFLNYLCKENLGGKIKSKLGN